MTFEELVLMPVTLARRALKGRRVRLRVLAPLGPVAGVGTLRVLRAAPSPSGEPEQVELLCGYEGYDPL